MDQLGVSGPRLTVLLRPRRWNPLALPAAVALAGVLAGALTGSAEWGWIAAGGLAGLSLSGSP